LEVAREFTRATDCFLLAAQNAVRLFAHQETVGLARRGLALLATLPDSPERARQELALQLTLGPPLSLTKGAGAPEIQTTYLRAHELCQKVPSSWPHPGHRESPAAVADRGEDNCDGIFRTACIYWLGQVVEKGGTRAAE
jgi:hypothetical protein